MRHFVLFDFVEPLIIPMNARTTIWYPLSYTDQSFCAVYSAPVSVVFIPLVFAGRGDFRPSDLER
jgi:hypothetical protein